MVLIKQDTISSIEIGSFFRPHSVLTTVGQQGEGVFAVPSSGDSMWRADQEATCPLPDFQERLPNVGFEGWVKICQKK